MSNKIYSSVHSKTLNSFSTGFAKDQKRAQDSINNCSFEICVKSVMIYDDPVCMRFSFAFFPDIMTYFILFCLSLSCIYCSQVTGYVLGWHAHS